MVNQQTLHIAFDAHQVAVQSNAPEVLSGLERIFRQMLEPEPTKTVGRLEARQQNGTYQLLENNEARLEYRSLSDVLDCLRYQVVLQLIQARPDLLWLHAGAVASQGGALIISGPSGGGKSALVTSLCAQGWTYLSDDIIPLDPSSGKAIPFLQTPMVRLPLSSPPVEGIEGGRALRKTEVSLKPETICCEAVPVRAVVFPGYSARSPTRLLPCSPAMATLELLENCRNFVHHREAAVRYLTNLVQCVPAFHVSFNSRNSATELITQAHEKGYLFGRPISKKVLF